MFDPAKTQSFSVVVPVYNESANLPKLIERLLLSCVSLQRPFEIIFVDDGSSDGSSGIISQAAKDNPGAIIAVSLNRNYGQHAAILAGFKQAQGDFILTIDADLQNPPEEIPKLIEKMDKGYDVVGTVRRNRQDTLFRRTASSIINKATAEATGVEMHDYGCMLRAYSRPVVEAMLQCHEHSTFIPVLANSFANRTTEIEVEHAARTEGESKYSVWKLINLQFDLLTGMTTFPLRLLSLIGAVIAFAGVGFGVLLLILRLFFGATWAADGVFTLFAILFIFVGAQFIGLGLLGEYIGRIYQDVRARPRYFIQRIDGKSNLGEN